MLCGSFLLRSPVSREAHPFFYTSSAYFQRSSLSAGWYVVWLFFCSGWSFVAISFRYLSCSLSLESASEFVSQPTREPASEPVIDPANLPVSQPVGSYIVWFYFRSGRWFICKCSRYFSCVMRLILTSLTCFSRGSSVLLYILCLFSAIQPVSWLVCCLVIFLQRLVVRCHFVPVLILFIVA